jgi:hypothetical protein
VKRLPCREDSGSSGRVGGRGGVALHDLAPTYLSDLVLPYILYLQVRYSPKTLLSLEFLSKQLEAELSPIGLHFYGMVCLSM